MAIIGLQTAKMHNNVRIFFLILLMPLVVFSCLLIFFILLDPNGHEIKYIKKEIRKIDININSINQEIKNNSINKNFDFINDEKKKLIPLIIEQKEKIIGIEKEIIRNKKESEDETLSQSEREINISRYNRRIDEKNKVKYILQNKINDFLNIENHNIEKLEKNNINEKLLLELYLNENIQKEFYKKIENLKTAFDLGTITFLYSLPIIIIWLIIGVHLQKKIIFNFTGAKELNRNRNPEIYNIVENLCISRGIPIPKIGVIEEEGMNAFATGWNEKNSHIIFSRGLVNNLNKEEIEAVAGHEITHILNGDIKTMVITNVFIGIIGTIAYILIRSGLNSRSSSKKGNVLPVLGLLLYVAYILILPLINLAISRKKEFLADAGSVELTKNRDAMISALEKISKNAEIEKVKEKGSRVASMFIFNPRGRTKGLISKIKKLFSTHPTLKERIEMLKKY